MNPVTPSLATFFKFTEGDVYVNRQGRLSEEQQTRLAKEAKANQRSSFFLGLLLLGVALFPSVTLVPGALQARDWLLMGPMLPWVCIWLPIWGWLGVALVQSAFTPPDYTLQQVTGPINLVAVERRSSSKSVRTYIAHELHVGGQTFKVEAAAGQYLMQGEQYAIYYLAASKKILSLERV